MQRHTIITNGGDTQLGHRYPTATEKKQMERRFIAAAHIQPLKNTA